MHLYRAQLEKPTFSTSELEHELYLLEQERDQGPAGEYMIDAFHRMGKEKYLRYIEIREVVVDQQFFTDDKERARFNATQHDYLVELDIPDELAVKHVVTPEEVGAVGGHAVSGVNYAFSGRELAAHKDDWSIVFKQV